VARRRLRAATYHWGYPEYRQDGLSRPETGNFLSIPTFATANSVGSVAAHVSQHVVAVTHAYESRIFNQPASRSAAVDLRVEQVRGWRMKLPDRVVER
jgi:hypothetical protein